MKNLRLFLLFAGLSTTALFQAKEGIEHAPASYFAFKNQFRHTQNLVKTKGSNPKSATIVTMKLCINDAEQLKHAIAAVKAGGVSYLSKETVVPSEQLVHQASAIAAVPKYELPVIDNQTGQQCTHAKIIFANTAANRDRVEKYLQSKLNSLQPKQTFFERIEEDIERIF